MSVFGDLKLVVSIEQVNKIKEAFKSINDLNIQDILITVITIDGTVHTLTVHDFNLIWGNEENE